MMAGLRAIALPIRQKMRYFPANAAAYRYNSSRRSAKMGMRWRCPQQCTPPYSGQNHYQSRGILCDIGCLVETSFESGYQRLEHLGVSIVTLAIIDGMEATVSSCATRQKNNYKVVYCITSYLILTG